MAQIRDRGTTGTSKGAVHVHEAVVAHHATGSFALDLHRGDVFWCTADPGWVTGTSYGIISPLTHGLTSIVDFLNLMIALSEQTGIEIPEDDHTEVATLDGCVAYLAAHGARV